MFTPKMPDRAPGAVKLARSDTMEVCRGEGDKPVHLCPSTSLELTGQEAQRKRPLNKVCRSAE